MTIGTNYDAYAYYRPAMASNIQSPGTYTPFSAQKTKEAVGNLYDPIKTGNASGSDTEQKPGRIIDPDKEKKPGRRSSPDECETCKERKYQDGSDENVSFKTAQHVSPQAAASAVRAHEQEHVANAYSKAAKDNGKVVQASVTIQTATCPECGRVYVSGGETHTRVEYPNEKNPYQQERKAQDAMRFAGANIDYVA